MGDCNCDNCGKPIWGKPYKTARHFCNKRCKVEFYYFLYDMSKRQLNILQHLIANDGCDVFRHGMSIDSMVFKVAALLKPLGFSADGLIEVQITERGRWWYKHHTDKKT